MVKEVGVGVDNKGVWINGNMEDVINLGKVEKFVGVVDDMEGFIGIVGGSEMIE
ncbi:CBS domain-containing protein [Paenibacillus xylanexedens]|uniref:CBS domain-containing protein n=1 Tax=Paenibacillus xylanexedens TaxID=528191 RepID=UPI00119F6181|nr:CBS domain-containing protein [Paenibacillus xylanexedens]